MKVSYPKLHSIKFKNGIHADNVVCLQSRMRADIPVEDVLYGAYQSDLKDIVIFGYDQDGYEVLLGSNHDHMKAHYMLSRAKNIIQSWASGEYSEVD